jgi:hypothetical protein
MSENAQGIGTRLEIRVTNSQDPQSSVEMTQVSFVENIDTRLR